MCQHGFTSSAFAGRTMAPGLAGPFIRRGSGAPNRQGPRQPRPARSCSGAEYCDHLPLYRQSQIFVRHGVELDRSTLANCIGGAVGSRLWIHSHSVISCLQRSYVRAAASFFFCLPHFWIRAEMSSYRSLDVTPITEIRVWIRGTTDPTGRHAPYWPVTDAANRQPPSPSLDHM